MEDQLKRRLLGIPCLWLLTGTLAIGPVMTLPLPAIAAVQQPTELNLTLLEKALTHFFQATTFQVESQVTINAQGDQFQVNIDNHTSTLTVLPRRFVSEIKLGTQQYFITSDGQTVWIYHRNRDRYREMSFEAFQDSEDSFFIGLASSFLLEIVRSLQQEQGNSTLDPAELLSAILQFFTRDYRVAGLSLSQDTLTQEGVEYTRYAYKTNGEDLTLVLWIDNQEQTLKKLQLLGSEQGIKINVQETILKQVFNPVVDEKAFQFQPSPALKKVEDLPLEPF
ncbi:MAG: LolA family protein [Microcystaceae cyanobacterium]